MFTSISSSLAAVSCTQRAFNKHLRKEKLREGTKEGTKAGGKEGQRRKREERREGVALRRPAQPHCGSPGSPQLPAELQLPACHGSQGGPPRPRPDQAPARQAPGVPCESRRRRSARWDLWFRQRVGGGAGMEAGGGRGRAQAPPPSLPAGLRAPERLFSVCAGGCRVWLGFPLPLTPPARRRPPPQRPLRLFPLPFPSSSPFFLPPSLSRRPRRRRPGPPAGGRARGSSQVRRPGRAWRGPRGRRGRGEGGGGWGLGLGGPARLAFFPGPLSRPRGLPGGGGSSPPPRLGAPRGLDPRRSSSSTPCWGQKQVPRRLS